MMGAHSANVIDDTPSQPLIIVGSAHWDTWGTIQNAIEGILENHPRIQLITSGCPTGAEWFAAEYISSMGHPAPVTMRDEELINVRNAIVLAFIKDKSPGATAVTRRLRRLFWTRVFRDDTYPQHTEWSRR
jgi:hypothetical protein